MRVNQTLTVETTNYIKNNSKWIEKGKKIENINEEQYNNFINSKSFFNKIGGYERHNKSYTRAGYIVIEINSISPDKSIKILRKFQLN